MMITIDRGQLSIAIRQGDGCGDVGWLNCTTGEILFVHEDADRFEEWYGLAAAIQMMQDRERISEDASNWIEIPKYRDGGDEAMQHFLDELKDAGIEATFR
jgi:hypothetical protein